MLYRSKADIIEQATDRLIENPAGEPFPVFYPPRLAGVLNGELSCALSDKSNVVLKPLPDPLPEPTLDPVSLYNNIGLLYLPNPYVVPGDTFNEMYGWDSFFIVEGLSRIRRLRHGKSDIAGVVARQGILLLARGS